MVIRVRPEPLTIDNLTDRRLYEVQARNFRIAVWSAKNEGFIGIREKFGQTYLDIEYHWDHQGWGTVHPLKDLGVTVPDDILLITSSSDLFEWLSNQSL